MSSRVEPIKTYLTYDGVPVQDGDIVWNINVQKCHVKPRPWNSRAGLFAYLYGQEVESGVLQMSWALYDCFSNPQAAISEKRKDLEKEIDKLKEEIGKLNEMEQRLND